MTIGIGVTVGMLAVGLAIGTETIIKHKNIVARDIIHDGHPAGVLRAALAHMAFSIGLACIGSILVNYYIGSVVPYTHSEADTMYQRSFSFEQYQQSYWESLKVYTNIQRNSRHDSNSKLNLLPLFCACLVSASTKSPG